MRTGLAAVWANPYIRIVVVLLALVAAYFILRLTQTVWTTVVLAFLIAYLLSPLVTRLERRGVHRAIGVLSATLVFLLMIASLWFLGTAIAAQITTFAERLPAIVATLEEIPFLLGRLLDPSFGAIFQQVYMTTRVLAQGLATEILPSVAGVGTGGLTGVITTVTGLGLQITVMFVLSLYLLYRYPVYSKSLLLAFPIRYRTFVVELAEKADRSVGGYIRGQLLISAFVAIFSGIGLTLLGVPLAIPLAVLAGVFNVVPFFGPIVVSVPTVIMAATLSLGHAVGALAVLFVVNQIDAHVLTPLIYSRTIELDPVTIVIAILLGLALFGLVGALVAVPIAAFVKLLYLDYYLHSRWYGAEVGPAPGPEPGPEMRPEPRPASVREPGPGSKPAPGP